MRASGVINTASFNAAVTSSLPSVLRVMNWSTDWAFGLGSFNAVGLPAFQFVQDPMEYDTRTHHSNMDVYDRVQPGDLMQSSAIMAAFVYNTAMRPEMLPRIPMPKPIAKARQNATE